MHHNDKTFNIIQILTVQPLAWCAKKIISSSILFLICCFFFNICFGIFFGVYLVNCRCAFQMTCLFPCTLHYPVPTVAPPPLLPWPHKVDCLFPFSVSGGTIKTKLAPVSFSVVDPHRIRVASKVRSSFQQLLHHISWDHQVFFSMLTLACLARYIFGLLSKQWKGWREYGARGRCDSGLAELKP